MPVSKRSLYYFFPFQLVLIHLRDNLLMVFIWLGLAMVAAGNLAADFGVRYLFVSPEYLGEVSIYSFFWVGVAFGIFVMCWHLSTYLLYAKRFPFLSACKRPFWDYCLNNSVIPLLFFGFYLYNQTVFEAYYELRSMGQFISCSFGFVGGSVVAILILSGYFAVTNKNMAKIVLKTPRLQALLEETEEEQWRDIATQRIWRVDFYLSGFFKIRQMTDTHPARAELRKIILRQNHLNALVIQFVIFLILVIVGNWGNIDYFRLPAGASIFLLCSLLVAAMGAMSYWFRRWQVVVFLIVLGFVNYMTNLDYQNQTNKAYGLDFRAMPAKYITDSLRVMFGRNRVEKDKQATRAILEKWRLKNEKKGVKPRMVIVCVSGGGLKASAWAMRVLQTADSLSNGQFMQQTALITGASGGMLGAAYYRELLLRQQAGTENIDLYGSPPLGDITKDLLNAISFSILTNDLFLPRSSSKGDQFHYRRDRGYAFERQFHENTHYRLDKALSDYAQPERDAQIPMMFITPAVLNDGRLMVISPHPVAYMMAEHSGEDKPEALLPDAVDFGAMFRGQNPGSLRFTTALRANATFPLVLPSVQLPSDPAIELVDAGFRDNVGLNSGLRFVHAFDEWIKTNTSGVTIVVVRAYDPNRYAPNSARGGLLANLINPLSFAGNFLFLQEYEYQSNLGFLRDKAGMNNLNVINFTYVPAAELRDAPTSFHLTNRERANIVEAVNLAENRAAFRQLLLSLEALPGGQ